MCPFDNTVPGLIGIDTVLCLLADKCNALSWYYFFLPSVSFRERFSRSCQIFCSFCGWFCRMKADCLILLLHNEYLSISHHGTLTEYGYSAVSSDSAVLQLCAWDEIRLCSRHHWHVSLEDEALICCTDKICIFRFKSLELSAWLMTLCCMAMFAHRRQITDPAGSVFLPEPNMMHMQNHMFFNGFSAYPACAAS